MDELSNNMGLFLQKVCVKNGGYRALLIAKVNIIRDYLEDIDHKRIFWPRQIW
jgi:hypothetical protein